MDDTASWPDRTDRGHRCTEAARWVIQGARRYAAELQSRLLLIPQPPIGDAPELVDHIALAGDPDPWNDAVPDRLGAVDFVWYAAEAQLNLILHRTITADADDRLVFLDQAGSEPA